MSMCKICVKENTCKYNDGVNVYCKGPCPLYTPGAHPDDAIKLPCKIGSTVYILVYDIHNNDKCVVDYEGYILLMINQEYALLSPTINGEEDPMEICDIRYTDLIENGSSFLDVGIIVPLEDLYFSLDDVVRAYKQATDSSRSNTSDDTEI